MIPPLLRSGRWAELLAPALATAEADDLRAFLHAEAAAGHATYPPADRIFTAFERTPFDRVRVVLLGQDPYHGPGQAMGLSFSVPRGAPHPPSLRNIFRELASDLGTPPPDAAPLSGDLSGWADQGVLLLNTTLTVRAGAAGSHAGRGWERITDAAIEALNAERDGLVFLLWGRHAQAQRSMIDPARHHILEAAHPSPLSAHRGFFGCRHFSRTNAILVEQGCPPIDWTRGLTEA